MPEVEIFRSGSVSIANPQDTITIRVGDQVATMPIGEWSRLMSRPQSYPIINQDYTAWKPDAEIG